MEKAKDDVKWIRFVFLKDWFHLRPSVKEPKRVNRCQTRKSGSLEIFVIISGFFFQITCPSSGNSKLQSLQSIGFEREQPVGMYPS